jgi:predicted TIM-barrel fold metal-dependent hydrolase
MRLDGHIHIQEGKPDPNGLLWHLDRAGFQGGLLISLPPSSFDWLASPRPYQERLDNLLNWTNVSPFLYPFFWIDPTEAEAELQVEAAIELGVAGFKVICNQFYPGDERALALFKIIADRGKPILFHSGILWDGQVSSRFNRPAGFEALLEVAGLVFSLAHIGWPWTDELIAVYGKFLNAYDRNASLSVEMFIDVTPGTPPIYRQEALTRLFTVGYDVRNNVIFGSDCEATAYNNQWTQQWIDRDCRIYAEIGLQDDTVQSVFGNNLIRFLSTERAHHHALRPGQ